MKPRYLLAAAALAAATASLGQAEPATPAHAATAAVLPPLEAANKLLATAWGPVAKQRADDAEKELEKSLADSKLAAGDGRKSGFKWALSLRLKNVNASIDMKSPPAFVRASKAGFKLEQPRGTGFDFAISADVSGKASVKAGGTTLFSWSPGFHFGLRIENFKVVAETELDSTRPNRPTVMRATVRPSFALRGRGFLPVSLPVSFTAETRGETIILRGTMTSVGLKESLSELDAKLTADIVITLLPRGVIDLNAPEPQFGVDVDDVPIKGDFRAVKVEFNGRLKASLKRVGSISVPFKLLDIAIPFPSPPSLDDMLRQISGAPKRWGDTKRAPYGPVPSPAELAAPVAEIEAGAAMHAPHGGVLTFDFTPGRGNLLGAYTYANEADSALFTGQYLAAESFRYAATQSADSLVRVKAALEGLRRMFWVTQDAVVTIADGKTARAPVTLGSGLLSRTAKPDTDPIRFTPGTGKASGPLELRPCHYMRPEGGWRAAGRLYPTLQSIPSMSRNLTPQPIGPIWYGWGCAGNHPVTRDQYVGVMMGLGTAFRLVPDPEVRAVAGALIKDTILYLLRNEWNVRLPPDNRLEAESSFVGDFPKQLAFLRIGKTAGVPAAAALYDELQRAAELAWLGPWLASYFPLTQYFKFNLSHSAFVPALLLEDDGAQRQRWYSSYLLLWEPVAHHKNAYFDLARILAESPSTRQDLLRGPASATNPSVSIGNEVKIVLAEWLRRWTLVKGKWGPLNKVADPAHLLRLWPSDFARYQTLDGTDYCLAEYALPIDGRRGKNAHFIWEHAPFRLSIGSSRCTRSPLPDSNQIQSQDSEREGPGVDFLLAYWLAVYLDVLPKP